MTSGGLGVAPSGGTAVMSKQRKRSVYLSVSNGEAFFSHLRSLMLDSDVLDLLADCIAKSESSAHGKQEPQPYASLGRWYPDPRNMRVPIQIPSKSNRPSLLLVLQCLLQIP